jgi:hypothetical protein
MCGKLGKPFLLSPHVYLFAREFPGFLSAIAIGPSIWVSTKRACSENKTSKGNENSTESLTRQAVRIFMVSGFRAVCMTTDTTCSDLFNGCRHARCGSNHFVDRSLAQQLCGDRADVCESARPLSVLEPE